LTSAGLGAIQFTVDDKRFTTPGNILIVVSFECAQRCFVVHVRLGTVVLIFTIAG
jgi:hypothetical protein